MLKEARSNLRRFLTAKSSDRHVTKFFSKIFVVVALTCWLNTSLLAQNLLTPSTEVGRIQSNINVQGKNQKNVNQEFKQNSPKTMGNKQEFDPNSANKIWSEQLDKKSASIDSSAHPDKNNQETRALISELRLMASKMHKTIGPSAKMETDRQSQSEKTTKKSILAEPGKISGYMFGDYYYEFSNPDSAQNAAKNNGFQFRRIYFTYDHNIAKSFSVRFRMELDSEAGETINPFIKNAYLAWKNFIPNATLYFGAQGTPSWETSEKVWGYRSIEKTIMDMRKVASSSDLGIAVKGTFGETSSVGYHLVFANGEGEKGENNKYKKVYLSLPIKLTKAFQVAPYADFEGGPDGKTKQTLALFAGVSQENFKGGVEVFQKTNVKQATNGNDLVENGLSVFGSLNLFGNIKGFARYDIYDPNTNINDDGKKYIVAGFDFEVEKGVKIMPNIKIETSDQSGKKDKLQGAVTFFYKF